MGRALFLLFITAFILFSATVSSGAEAVSISITAPQSLLASNISSLAISDTVALLSKATGSNVRINSPGARVKIILPDIRNPAAKEPKCAGHSDYHCIPVPDDSFSWQAIPAGANRVLRLKASTPIGVSNGLYALLQEKLGFRFYHPRESIIPELKSWPLPARFSFSGTPRFEKRGFHLHTLHPIELTEQLHNPGWPNAFEDIREYLDWLARNGQNSFQFFLLRGIDRKKWPPHAKRIVDYAHKRGILCGVEISLSMLQQQAFQAITMLRPFPSYTRQVDSALEWLFIVPWDFITLEATMGEHLPFLDRLLPDIQSHIEHEVAARYGAKLMYATHVICPGKGEKVRRPRLKGSGILVHTVMCYSATEERAPVYGNRNQNFMFEAAKAEKQRRETWYWPESSYWVGFDTSVPLLLLPYLETRWQDIATMSETGLSGHLTFSSGWEWGYWLVDWSIARWSWDYRDNRRRIATSPLSGAGAILGDAVLTDLLAEALRIQNLYLKEKELIRYLAAMTPFSELPDPFRRPFQPEPAFRYDWLLAKANDGEVASILEGPVSEMDLYSKSMGSLCERFRKRLLLLEKRQVINPQRAVLARELITALEVSALRGRHRALTIRGLVAKRRDGGLPAAVEKSSSQYLELAHNTREEAQKLVSGQAGQFRYPAELINSRREGMTAYPFGYLYPATTLHFWEREEQQVRHRRFDPLFMNIWDIRRTLGIESLFLKY